MSKISNLIDSHQHFWKYDPVKHSWIGEEMANIRRDFLPEDLRPLLDNNRISGTVLVQADQSEAETQFLLEQGEKFPFVKGVVGWVDLTAENVEERLVHYKEHKLFKGVRHTVWDEQGEFMLDSFFQRGISALGKLDLTYDLLVFDYQLQSAIKLVQKFPEQRFVLDHMGKPKITSGGPSLEWERDVRELANSGNVYCKLSGMFTETPGFNWTRTDFLPFLQVVSDAFGEDHIMFGSDWPVSLSAASYEETIKVIKDFFVTSGVETCEKIFRMNAMGFYRL